MNFNAIRTKTRIALIVKTAMRQKRVSLPQLADNCNIATRRDIKNILMGDDYTPEVLGEVIVVLGLE